MNHSHRTYYFTHTTIQNEAKAAEAAHQQNEEKVKKQRLPIFILSPDYTVVWHILQQKCLTTYMFHLLVFSLSFCFPTFTSQNNHNMSQC